MAELLPFLVAAGCLAATLGGLAWLASRTRRRGVGREIMGPIDEIYRPHVHQVHIEIRAQERRVVPMPSPDDQWSRSRTRRRDRRPVV